MKLGMNLMQPEVTKFFQFNFFATNNTNMAAVCTSKVGELLEHMLLT
jgi:hypothetical protein